jgi:hypothetical protein
VVLLLVLHLRHLVLVLAVVVLLMLVVIPRLIVLLAHSLVEQMCLEQISLAQEQMVVA